MMDANGEPLIGANLNIHNTKIGCSTNLDGKFEISMDNADLDSKILVAQHLGFYDMQMDTGDVRNSEIKVTLVESIVLLGEIVVLKQPIHKRVWYGIKNLFAKG